MKRRVAIVGGGIGGLTAALALLKRGFDVDLYEQAPELREAGAGLQISANGCRVLACLGALDELKALSCEAAGKEIRLWNSGQTWKLFDLGAESVARYGYPYLTAYRPDLVGVLASAVRREKRDAIHPDSRVVSIDEQDGGVVLRMENGRKERSDLAVGADGVHSRVRQALFGEDKPRFTGLVAWRGTVPMEKLPPHLRRMVGTNWVGPGGHVVHYPVRRGELMNFVGVTEKRDWQVESWTAEGTADECAADFEGWNEDVHRMIRGAPRLYKWALVARAPMQRWSQGRVTLLGDACHPTLPFLAQGAVMAMEDGLVLARALEQSEEPASAFARYEAARMARTHRVVTGSAENARRFHDARLADAEAARQYVDREWSEARVRERYEWLFTYDAATAGLA